MAHQKLDLLSGGVQSEITRKHRLAGTTTVDGTPMSRRVVIFDRRTAEYVASVVSEPDGSWEVSGLPEYPTKTLLAVALDETDGTYNAATADFLTQVDNDGN